MNDKPEHSSSRRTFLQSAASGALGGAVAYQIGMSRSAAADRKKTLRIGLIGCGGRGTGAAVQALNADEHTELVSMGDLFEDQLQRSLDLLRKQASDKVNVAPDRQFLGFDAYQKVIDSGVDVVLLTTPPGFRPQHLRAAIEAGKHAFVEITAAIDAPGVRSVLESAELARQKNVGILSGFCWRYDQRHRAVADMIREGAIGEVRAIHATYYRGSLSHKYHGPRTPEMSDLEWQIRDWYDYGWLSGDVTLLLSGGHSVDKMAWWLGDVMPITAVGIGSRVYPTDGNTFDNGFVVYEYESGVRGFLGCRSQPGCHDENADYIIGSKGICTIGRGRVPVIEGETNWRYEGPINNMYQTEHNEFIASIREGRPINEGQRMAHTTLMTLMGRMAAYTGQQITWEQALESEEKLTPDDFDWETSVELPPVPTPGVTPFR